MSRFSTVQDPPLLDVKGAPRPPQDHSRGSFRRFLRNVERSARILIKGSIRAIAVSVRGQYSQFPTALPGDIILLAGENWSRHDFSVLQELKKNRKVHIAAVLQDMIPCIHSQFFEAGSCKTRFQAYVEFLSISVDVIFTFSKSTTEDFLRLVSGKTIAVSHSFAVTGLNLGRGITPVLHTWGSARNFRGTACH